MKISTSAARPVFSEEQGEVYLRVQVHVPQRRAKRIPVTLLAVLDRSGSMASPAVVEDGQCLNSWTVVERAMERLLPQLTPEDSLGIISFESGATLHLPAGKCTAEHLRKARQVMAGLFPGGSTAMHAGLSLALQQLRSDQSGAKVVLLSDGFANVGPASVSEMAALADQIARQGGVVSTLGIGCAYDPALLGEVAQHGGGNFLHVSELQTLPGFFAEELRQATAALCNDAVLTLTLPADLRAEGNLNSYPQDDAANRVHVRLGALLRDRDVVLRLVARDPVANIAADKLEIGAQLRYTQRSDGSAKQYGDTLSLRVACEDEVRATPTADEVMLRVAELLQHLGTRLGMGLSAQGQLGSAIQTLNQYQVQLDQLNYNYRLSQGTVAAVSDAHNTLANLSSNAANLSAENTRAHYSHSYFTQTSSK